MVEAAEPIPAKRGPYKKQAAVSNVMRGCYVRPNHHKLKRRFDGVSAWLCYHG